MTPLAIGLSLGGIALALLAALTWLALRAGQAAAEGFAQGAENAAMRTCSIDEWLTLAAPRIEQDELADPDNWGER